jgi:hypothetical protein
MKTETLTFEAFQATRRIATPAEVDAITGGTDGWMYAGYLVIEDASKWENSKAKYYLMLSNEEYLSDDLEELERKLYAFYAGEQFVELSRVKLETCPRPTAGCNPMDLAHAGKVTE